MIGTVLLTTMSLSGHKRAGEELVRVDETVKRSNTSEYAAWEVGWTELFLDTNSMISSLKSQLAETRGELTETKAELSETKKHLADMDEAYHAKVEEYERREHVWKEYSQKYTEHKTLEAILYDEIASLKKQLYLYKSKNPGIEQFDPAFFDEASEAWKANKKSKGNGMYEYKKK